MLFRKSAAKILSLESPRQVVFGLVDRLRKDKRDFSRYTNAERLLWCLNVLYTESQNGTLEQYAANSSGDLFEETRDRLRLIGAHETAEILDSLNELLGGKMTASRSARIAAIEAARSEDEPRHESQICALTDSLDWKKIFSKAADHLRAHKDELA